MDIARDGKQAQARVLSTFTPVTAEKPGTALTDVFAQVPLKKK